MDPLIYPIFAMVVLTFSVLLWAFTRRLIAVRKRQVKPRYFRAMQANVQTAEIPEHIIIGARHFANLFEMPVLFYVVSLLALVLHIQSPAVLATAWGFVVLRFVHTIIHLSYNAVIHRAAAYFISNSFLLAMWILVLIKAAN